MKVTVDVYSCIECPHVYYYETRSYNYTCGLANICIYPSEEHKISDACPLLEKKEE